MRYDKPPIELVIRAHNEISHEQARAITLAANLNASISVYLDEEPHSNVWWSSVKRADYIEIGSEVVKDRSGQYRQFDKSKPVTNY